MCKLSRKMMFVLLILYGLVGVLLIRTGIVNYERNRIVNKAESERRTPNSYITNKIRAHNMAIPLEIRNQEGCQILVLTDKEEGRKYETWVYCLNQKLYESHVIAGNKLDLDLGTQIMDLNKLSFNLNETCLKVRFTTKRQEVYELLFEEES